MPDWLQDWLSYDDIVLLAWFFVAIFCLVTLPGFVVVIVQEKAIRKRKSLEEFVVSYVVIVVPVVILFLLIKTISRLRPKTSLVRTIGRGLPV